MITAAVILYLLTRAIKRFRSTRPPGATMADLCASGQKKWLDTPETWI